MAGQTLPRDFGQWMRMVERTLAALDRRSGGFGPRATRAAAPPTSGPWGKGDLTWNTNPATGQPVGWVCTVAGTPGTWRPFGTIA